MNFVVLCSSRGTTFQAIIDRMNDGSLKAKCLGLITDSSERGCIQRAKAANIPVKIVEKKENESREEYDQRLETAIRELVNEANLQPITYNLSPVIAAMGWMWILTEGFVKNHTIINVHPALLPKYGGKGMYGHHVHKAVLENKDANSGITIHVMDSGIDTGKVLLQKTTPVSADDTVETLQARVQELEKKWYPEVLQMIENGELKMEN